MTMAGQLDLSARAIKVEIEDLRDVALPAILHWNLSHFVVLKSVSRHTVVIHDPAIGAKTYSFSDLSDHFTGVALELAPAASFQKLTAKAPLRLNSLWTKISGLSTAVIQVIGLSVALQVVAFALPFEMQLVVDEAIMRNDVNLLSVLALGFGALFVTQVIIEALRNWSLQVFGYLLSYQIVGNILRHLMRLPATWFEKRHVGDILSRIASANAIQEILTHGIVAALLDGVMAVIAVAILFVYSPTLALVVLASVAVSATITAVTFPILRARTQEQIVDRAREQSFVMETVRASTTIKLMGRESEREGSWRNLYARVLNKSIAVGKFQIYIGSTQSLISGLQSVLIVYLGARMVLDGSGFSIGMLLAFLSFRQTFTDRVTTFVNQLMQFRFVGLHLDRLSDIVTAEAEPLEEAPFTQGVAGGMSVKDVRFQYSPADRQVLRGVDIEIRPGEFLAITGESGGGKTTLFKLLLGLLTPTSGKIELDGQLATPQAWRTWRLAVGVVSQDDRLLSGTIADNIAFFDPNLDMQAVRAAAEAAQIHADITQMPMQYLSLVGDMGSSLSGGQKQRVLLARALYRKPKILMLDEGTANLDVKTEEIIAKLISGYDMTRIVVAHRPALLKRADRVLVVAAGRIDSPAT